MTSLKLGESKQKPGSDSETVKMGNFQAQEEWLEQVEEADQRVAVPLCEAVVQ